MAPILASHNLWNISTYIYLAFEDLLGILTGCLARICWRHLWLRITQLFHSPQWGELHIHNAYLEQPRQHEAAIIIDVWWKNNFWRGQPSNILKRSFFDETEVFGFKHGSSVFQQIVMFWVEWDSFNSTGAAQTFSTWRKHNSYVQLENFFQKSDSLKRNKSVTKRRKFPTEPSIFFLLLAIYIWILTCYTYLPMFSRMGEYQESVTNVSMVADLARNPPNSLNESLWLRQQNLLNRL